MFDVDGRARFAGLYDWMAAELVAMADEAVRDSEGTGPGRELVRQSFLAVAQFVSESRGSGAVRTVRAVEGGE